MDFIKKINLYLFNISILFIVGTINLIRFVTVHHDFIALVTNVLFIYICAIITFIAYKKNIYKWNAFLYYMIGAIMIMFANVANISGIILIIFSLRIYNTKKTNYLILIITLSLLTLKSVIGNYSITAVVGLITGYASILMIYYILFQPKEIKCNTNNQIDQVTQEILSLLISGYAPKEISDKINISPDAVRKRIQRVCKSFECKNTEQLIYKLMEKRYFCLK